MRSKVRKTPTETPSQNLRLISKLVNSKKFKALNFKKGRGKISFSLEIDSNPALPKDWSFHALVVPDVKSHEHEHYTFDEKEMRKVRDYIDRILVAVERVKKSKRK